MDLVAEYARAYGGPPRADQSWHEVLALARRCGRFDARDRLVVADGAGMAAAGDAALPQLQRRQLLDLAYPERA